MNTRIRTVTRLTELRTAINSPWESTVSLGVLVLAVAFFLIGVAEAAEQQVSASNGVVISVNGDEFDGRLKYTAPLVNFGDDQGFFLVAAVKQNGRPVGPIEIVGYALFKGEWRHYFAANLRGGDTPDGGIVDKRVATCSGSRYGSGCPLKEDFRIKLTDAQIANYATAEYLDMKLNAAASTEVPVIRVPLAYIQAVMEVSRGTRKAAVTSQGVRVIE